MFDLNPYLHPKSNHNPNPYPNPDPNPYSYPNPNPTPYHNLHPNPKQSPNDNYKLKENKVCIVIVNWPHWVLIFKFLLEFMGIFKFYF